MPTAPLPPKSCTNSSAVSRLAAPALLTLAALPRVPSPGSAAAISARRIDVSFTRSARSLAVTATRLLMASIARFTRAIIASRSADEAARIVTALTDMADMEPEAERWLRASLDRRSWRRLTWDSGAVCLQAACPWWLLSCVKRL